MNNLINHLEASGLNVIVIDENTDFDKLTLPTIPNDTQILETLQAKRRAHAHDPVVYWALTAVISTHLHLDQEAIDHDLDTALSFVS